MSTSVVQISKTPKEKTKRIVVSERNYNKLMQQGKFKETFDDVITRILTSQKERGAE